MQSQDLICWVLCFGGQLGRLLCGTSASSRCCPLSTIPLVAMAVSPGTQHIAPVEGDVESTGIDVHWCATRMQHLV